MPDQTVDEGTITTPLGSLSFKGKSGLILLGMVCVALLSVGAYSQYDLKQSIEKTNRIQETGFDRMAEAQKEQNAILREQLCLLALPPEKREREFMNEVGFCKRLSRER